MVLPIHYIIGGIGLGGYLFVQGFRWMRQKRLIENVPTSKIRSLAMGLVEINGTVRPREKKLLTSPLLEKPCVYYTYRIQQYRSSGKSGRWVTLKKATKSIPFYLKDDTAQVLIDLDKANVQLKKDYYAQTCTFARGKVPPSVQAFLKTHKIKSTSWFGTRRKMRFLETYVEPRDALYILGTAGDNPHMEEGAGKHNVDDIMIQHHKGNPFYVSDSPEKNVLSGLKLKMYLGLIGGGFLLLIGTWLLLVVLDVI